MVLLKEVTLDAPLNINCRHCEKPITLTTLQIRVEEADWDYDPNSGYGLQTPTPPPPTRYLTYVCQECNDWFALVKEYVAKFAHLLNI